MGRCTFADGTVVSDYDSPYIIAEVNSSHNGNMDTAKLMIDAAAAAGCDCVKFQSWTAQSLYSKTYYKENPIAQRFVNKFSLSPSQLKLLAEYCTSRNIAFSSTPYSREEVDFLIEECNIPFIKIASMELNNSEYLEYIAKKGIPIVLSTGMGEIEEIKNAVKILENAGNQNLVILHCVSIYPVEDERINLNNITGFREIFPSHPIGFSDHTLGDTAAVASIALGACVIEKHMTLDSKKIGMDNQMAMEPEALTSLVKKCHATSKALGHKNRILHQDEYVQRKNMRRSVVSVRDLAEGTILKREDLYVKRPGTGIPPDGLTELIGCRLKRTIEADCLIFMDDVERC